MRLSEIRIKNFRSFQDQTISLDSYTCLVGPNGAGKSTVLQALNILFRNTAGASVNLQKLSDEDFHHKNTDEPIEITLSFEELSPEAQEDFKAYYRNNKLVVSAIARWDANANVAEVKQYGSRLVMSDFAPFFDAVLEKASAQKLKEIYKVLREKYTELPAVSTKDDMEKALRGHEELHPELCEILQSDHQFYGWSKGANRLQKYIQWVYVPAVKDAASEQEEGKSTALGQLLERTVRTKVNFQEPINALKKEIENRYEEIINKEQHVLDSLSTSLTGRIQEWTHTGTEIKLNWHYNPDKSINVIEPLARLAAGEHEFLGEIARLGHGLQRTVLVSLLQELAESTEKDAPTLLLGFEEPELYQHPPQARHMASLLEVMATKISQVLLTTHSPYFVSGKGFENIRMIRKSPDNNKSVVSRATYKQIADQLAAALGEDPRSPTSIMAAIGQIMQPSQNELYFAGVVVLVEGVEDVAYLSTYLHLCGKWSEFRKHGCHFVISAGKENMSRPLVIANALGISTFTVFDSDAEGCRNDPDGDKSVKHRKSNACIMSLCGLAGTDPMPQETIWADNAAIWLSSIDGVVQNDFGVVEWGAAEQQAKEKHGFLEGVKRKNAMLIAATLEELYGSGKRSESLEKLCSKLLEFAKNH